MSIFALDLDALTGAVIDVLPSPVQGQVARSAALGPGGQFLFIGHGQMQGTIDTYALPADGVFAQPVSTFPVEAAAGLPLALATDAAGSFLYAGVANLGLAGYAVDSGSGALSALPGPPAIGPPIPPVAVLAADADAGFPYLYFQERVFGITPASGGLVESLNSPLPVGGGVTGIAAASPADQLPDDDPVNPITGPVTSLSPASLQFAEQWLGGASAPLPIALANTGAAPLVLTGIELTGTNAADFGLSHDCLAVINVNAGCTISITFEPESEGPREAFLSVVDNAPDSPHTVALGGTGQQPFTYQIDSAASSIMAGQMAQYDLRLLPAPGAVGKVFLACTGVPEQASCDFPASLDLDGATPVLFSVRVLTRARSMLGPVAGRYPFGGRLDYFAAIVAAGVLLMILPFVLGAGRTATRRLAFGGAAAAIVICAGLTLVSCSGSAEGGARTSTGSPSPVAGTPAGQYTLTIAATFGSAGTAIPLSLTVQ